MLSSANKLQWSGGEEFAAAEFRPWSVDGKTSGKTKSAAGFTFATVDGAGHMVSGKLFVDKAIVVMNEIQVPYDKPKEGLEFVKRWLLKRAV